MKPLKTWNWRQILGGALALLAIEALMWAWLTVHEYHQRQAAGPEIIRAEFDQEPDSYVIHGSVGGWLDALHRAKAVEGCFWYDQARKRYVVAGKAECGRM